MMPIATYDHPCLAEARREQSPAHLQKARLRLRQHEDLDEVAAADRRDQDEDDRLDEAHPKPLQAPAAAARRAPVMMTAQNSGMWNSRLSATALPSTSARSQAPMASFAHEPVGPARPRGIPIAAALGQILAGDDAQPRGDDLHEDRHQAGQRDDPEQAVLELCAGLQIGAPVAGVHVADADENGRAHEGPPLLPESRLVMRNGHRAVHAFEGNMAADFDRGRRHYWQGAAVG